MIILIPLGGTGQRFKDFTNKPKALFEVEGKPIICHLLDNLNQAHKLIDYIYIPYNREYISHDFENILSQLYPTIKFKFLPLNRNTDGAAHTVNIALRNIITDTDQPIICIDSDNFYTTDIISIWNGNNTIFTFTDYSDGTPRFSYINTDDNIVTYILEKERISNIACTGAYGFSSFHELYKYTEYIIDKNITSKNEYYISTVIQTMISSGIKFHNHTIHNKDYFSLGTPEQVSTFEHAFLFDLDGTLVDTDDLYIAIWNDILKEYDIIIDASFFDKNIKGKSDTNFLKSLIPNITDLRIKNISERKDSLFIDNIDKIKIFHNALEFMQRLQNNRIAIVTNCNRQAATKVLEHFNLNHYVNVLIASDDCQNTKPDAEPYLLAMNLLNIEDKNKCIVFEDSLTGYMSAKNAGIHNIIIKLSSDKIMHTFKEKKFSNYNELNIRHILSEHTNQDIIRKCYKMPIYYIEDTGTDIKSGGGYICNVYSYKISMKYNQSQDIILKISNADNPLSETATKLDLYNNEKIFYEKIASKVDDIIKVPKCYGIFENDSKIAVLLENLNLYSGSFNVDLNDDINMLLKVVNDISKLHLKFQYEECGINGVKKMNEFTHYNTLIKERYQKFKERNDQFIPDKLSQYFDIIASKFDKILDELSSYPLNLCHGDLKSPNIFYRQNYDRTEPYFLDWQYVNLSKGVTDIIFLLCESIDFDCAICDIVIKYYYTLIKAENPLYLYDKYIYELRLALCAFPVLVSVWFNTEDKNILVNKTFPLRFLQNTMQYMDYLLDDAFINSLR